MRVRISPRAPIIERKIMILPITGILVVWSIFSAIYTAYLGKYEFNKVFNKFFYPINIIKIVYMLPGIFIIIIGYIISTFVDYFYNVYKRIKNNWKP